MVSAPKDPAARRMWALGWLDAVGNRGLYCSSHHARFYLAGVLQGILDLRASLRGDQGAEVRLQNRRAACLVASAWGSR